MPASPFESDDIYKVEAVRRACELLKAFSSDTEILRLRDLVARTSISTTTVFRLIHTLEQQGLVEKVARNSYRSRVKIGSTPHYRFGYASQGEDCAFAQEWSDSIVRAAHRHRVDLISLDNGFDPDLALRNADSLIDAKVDVAIEHQFNEHIAPAIAAKFRSARIPLIAMGTAHPGATYFGGNNQLAGIMGGRALGRWANKHWNGLVDELILVELSMAGPLLRSRLAGIALGVRETGARVQNVVRLTGKGQFGGTMELVRRHLGATRARRILLGAVNDPCALGALSAFEKANWEGQYAVIGQGGAIEARRELRKPNTRLIGTIGYFPETYGESIMSIAHALLRQETGAAAIFTKHQLITAQNVDRLYPNDALCRRTPSRAGLPFVHH
jgi:ribose transport system substrate-binding protein